MDTNPLPYEVLILVCTNRKEEGRQCCGASGSDDLRARLKEAVKARGGHGRVRVVGTGCLGKCAEGPNLMVLPEGTWYSHVTEADLPGILDRYAPITPAPSP
jgi:(2Fe-2S) ferredoxin